MGKFLLVGDNNYSEDEILDLLETGELRREHVLDALVADIRDGERYIERTEEEIKEAEHYLERARVLRRWAIKMYKHITGEEW